MSLLDDFGLTQAFGWPRGALEQLPALTYQDILGGEPTLKQIFQRRPPARNPIITIPGLQDLVHLVPESFLPEEQQRQNKRDRIYRLKSSPLPQSLQAVTRIVTAVDNVQDALVTASVLVRIAALGAPELAPVAIGLGAAADSLNALNMLAGLPLNPLSSKANWKALARTAWGSQAVRAKTATNLTAALPGIGETFQILQTTDQLFGVGIQIGPLMGLLPATVLGTIEGADIAYRPRADRRLRDEILGDAILNGPGILEEVRDSLEGLIATPDDLSDIAILAQPLTFAEHYEALLAASLGAELGRALIPRPLWADLIRKQQNLTDRDKLPKNHITRQELYRAGIDPDTPTPRALIGIPARPTIQQLSDPLRTQAPLGMAQVLKEAPSDRQRLAASKLAVDLPFRLLRALEGPSVAFEAHDAPHTRVITDTMELGLLPPPFSTVEQRRTYLETAARLYDIPDAPIPTHQLRQVWTEAFRRPPQ